MTLGLDDYENIGEELPISPDEENRVNAAIATLRVGDEEETLDES